MDNKAERSSPNYEILNSTGMRVTSQRSSILEIIRQGRGHLDADEIHRRGRKKQPRLSLSTVYRTLRTLKKLSLIEELHFDEEHHHYEVKPSSEHHHLVCLGCGRVIEFNRSLSCYIKSNVPEARDFEVVDTEIRVSGYCLECQQVSK